MANMACTIKEHRSFPGIDKITFAWTSDDAAGTASGATTNTFTGEVIRCITKPGTAGVQPTDQYDFTLVDDDSVDVLLGGGANRSNVNTEQVTQANLGALLNSKLTLSLQNAGNAKQGLIVVYIRKPVMALR